MKQYKVTAHVTTKYTVEVHAETEDDAQAQTEDFDHVGIGNAGEFEEFVGVEVTDVEVLHPEDHDEDNVGVELTPEDQADLAEAEEALAEPKQVKLNDDGSIDLDSLKGSEGVEDGE